MFEPLRNKQALSLDTMKTMETQQVKGLTDKQMTAKLTLLPYFLQNVLTVLASQLPTCSTTARNFSPDAGSSVHQGSGTYSHAEVHRVWVRKGM